MKTAPAELYLSPSVRRRGIALMMLAFFMLPRTPLAAQQAQPETHRKVVQKVVPPYPELARPMRLSGIVRVSANVAPNGKVLSAAVLGGHPLLARVAVDAVRQWRFEPSPQPTEEVVFITFQP